VSVLLLSPEQSFTTMHVFVRFKQMIAPIAERLNISPDRIYANEILFDAKSGAYKGFNEEAFTSRSGG
jgi:hypothetical protein